jgi:Ca-activated chloride channel family protein
LLAHLSCAIVDPHALWLSMRFHFATPGFLWLCLAVPPLVWWWLRLRRPAVRYPATGLVAGLPSGRAQIARWGGAGLRGLSLVLLAVALAGPRWPDLRTRIDTEGIAVMMVVDVSGSMGTADFNWDGEKIARLDAAKRAFALFVKGGPSNGGADFAGRPTDLVGIVAFASRPEAVCPPTLSHSVVLKMLEKQEPVNVATEADTNLSDALVVALVRLKNTPAQRKVIVLLSDGDYSRGESNMRSGWKPEEVALIAAEMKVPIYCIDADCRPANTTTERREAIETQQTLAGSTGGRYFPAGDTPGLLAAYQSIDRLEKSDITSYQYRRYYEAYPWLAGAAFALLALVSMLEMTIWRKLP